MPCFDPGFAVVGICFLLIPSYQSLCGKGSGGSGFESLCGYVESQAMFPILRAQTLEIVLYRAWHALRASRSASAVDLRRVRRDQH